MVFGANGSAAPIADQVDPPSEEAINLVGLLETILPSDNSIGERYN
jgi:hypothetical protein